MRLCCVTSKDLKVWQGYVEKMTSSIFAIAGDDKYGLDPNPYLGLPKDVGNPVAAFSMNVRNVKARIVNLIRFISEIM